MLAAEARRCHVAPTADASCPCFPLLTMQLAFHTRCQCLLPACSPPRLAAHADHVDHVDRCSCCPRCSMLVARCPCIPLPMLSCPCFLQPMAAACCPHSLPMSAAHACRRCLPTMLHTLLAALFATLLKLVAHAAQACCPSCSSSLPILLKLVAHADHCPRSLPSMLKAAHFAHPAAQ